MDTQMIGSLPTWIANPTPEVYLDENYVIFDFETTNLDKGHAGNPRNRVVGAAYILGPDHPLHNRVPGERPDADGDQVEWKRGGEYEQGGLVEAIERASFCVAHNAKFDLAWAERCGVDIGDVKVYDTMLGEYVLGGNSYKFYQLSLDAVAKRYGLGGKEAIVSMMMKAGICPSDMPESWLEKYGKMDVELTHRIFLAQREKLAERGQLPVVWCRNMLAPVLTDMEKNGMVLDPDRVLEYADEIEAKHFEVLAELEEMTDGQNLSSPQQLADLLYNKFGFEPLRKKVRGKWVDDLTATGGFKTDAATIERLKPKTAEAKRFIEKFREMKGYYNELTKYLRKFNDVVHENGGVITAQFNQAATQTHRLSSTGRGNAIQLHNIQRSYKPMFKARKTGWLMAEADGAQLEFRVAAHLARDEQALQDIVDGVDVHQATANIIGCSRQDAKAHTFKPLYGGMSGTKEEQEYYAWFRDRYKGVTAMQEDWKMEAVNTQKQETEWGLTYFWPGCQVDSNGYTKYSTNICNYPVQAFATAEIIPLALICFWHRLRTSEYRMFLVNTIHDSIIAEVPEEETEAFHALSKQCLIDDVYELCEKLYGVKLTVPLGAGVKMAPHWGEGEEVVYQAEEALWR
jgi:DNA polymerase-1